jgi:hypothetical protein
MSSKKAVTSHFFYKLQNRRRSPEICVNLRNSVSDMSKTQRNKSPKAKSNQDSRKKSTKRHSKADLG